MGKRGMGAQVRTVEDRRGDSAPFLIVELREIDLAPDGGVVDEMAEPAEALNRGRNERFRTFGRANIGDLCHRLAACVADLTRDPLRLGRTRSGVDHHCGAGLCQRARNRASYVARAAGDDGNAADKIIAAVHLRNSVKVVSRGSEKSARHTCWNRSPCSRRQPPYATLSMNLASSSAFERGACMPPRMYGRRTSRRVPSFSVARKCPVKFR